MKLQLKKLYKTRKNDMVEIVLYDKSSLIYNYQGSNKIYYNENGRCNVYEINIDDLIEEVENTDTENFFLFVEQEQADLLDLMRRKSKAYTAKAGPFANFDAAQDFGIDPMLGLLLRMSDKFQRLKSFSKDNKLYNVDDNEGVEDAFKDIIGYAYLALGMIHVKRNK